jgi:hypothetical protein
MFEVTLCQQPDIYIYIHVSTYHSVFYKHIKLLVVLKSNLNHLIVALKNRSPTQGCNKRLAFDPNGMPWVFQRKMPLSQSKIKYHEVQWILPNTESNTDPVILSLICWGFWVTLAPGFSQKTTYLPTWRMVDKPNICLKRQEWNED